ncbi:hypothetical protein LOOC260_102180 [Paucilactobacillus hokkaidonensis JCM 18461]|uniref:Uncharacterized protein n=2 Tax=Paucilactobacillus hokkaidonensis TaxID=1193095 RepID=A0A0A1GWM7_9LACO|nr:hypothetical protein [Paucilactobacillus hokkaidonensis]BAP84796.1 hypothetical protein LOOC260_102180 [Paucilactobacillus hokkaidonensis JCM 18461]
MELILKNIISDTETYEMTENDILEGLIKLGYAEKNFFNIVSESDESLNISKSSIEDVREYDMQNDFFSSKQSDLAIAA